MAESTSARSTTGLCPRGQHELAGQTSVLIVGGGPAGLTLANLLGSEGVTTLLVERNPGCVPEPRAVALDGESLRTLQAAGLADTVTGNIKQGFVADYINGDGVHLFTTDLTARPYGYCLQNTFDQPTLERQLLAGLSRFPCVTVAHSTELVHFPGQQWGHRGPARRGRNRTACARQLWWAAMVGAPVCARVSASRWWVIACRKNGWWWIPWTPTWVTNPPAAFTAIRCGPP